MAGKEAKAGKRKGRRMKPMKIAALVVSAIQDLREIKGSTPKKITGYISYASSMPEQRVKRQVNIAGLLFSNEILITVSIGVIILFVCITGSAYTYVLHVQCMSIMFGTLIGPSVINNLIFTPLTQCRRFEQKTIALIEINVGNLFFCTFSIFACQSLSQACVCKGCTNAKFVSIPQIVPNNDILIGRESEICRDGFRFKRRDRRSRDPIVPGALAA